MDEENEPLFSLNAWEVAPRGKTFRKMRSCGIIVAFVVLFAWSVTVTVMLAQSRSSDSGPLPPTWSRTVVFMRHCVRAARYTILLGEPGFTNVDNYTASPFPKWPTLPYTCLPRGLEILKGQGHHLRGQFPGRLTVVSDAVQRDFDTATSLLDGLGTKQAEYLMSYGHEIFDPFKAGICQGATPKQMDKILEDRMQIVLPPRHHLTRLATMQGALGTGTASPLQDIEDRRVNGQLIGGTNVAYEISEMLLLQFGGGIPIFRSISLVDVYEFLVSHVYYRAITQRNSNSVRRMSNIASHTLNFLSTSSSDATLAWVGHDTTIDGMAAMLGLSWSIPPYPDNDVPPGSMLVFELQGSRSGGAVVNATFRYTTFNTTDGAMTTVPATFVGGSSVMDWHDFREAVEAQVAPECVSGPLASNPVS